ncbi:MAG: hypothetical protein NTV48_03435 [Candidatus Vogelbacteria bacterium]|nr:hypothetical protein [Candidatus Vogelbacteria bacterium]
MTTVLAIGIAVVALGLALGSIPASFLGIWILAKKNAFFTTREEGKIKAEIVGGKIESFVFALDGYRQLETDEDATDYNSRLARPIPARQWEIVPEELAEPVAVSDNRFLRWLNREFGIEWIGLWPAHSIYQYKLSASTVVVDDDGNTTGKRHNELTQFVYAKRVAYHSKFPARTHPNQGIEVEIEYIFYLRCINPYIALFGLDDWYVAVTNFTNALGVRFVASRLWEEINVHTDVYGKGTTKNPPKMAVDREKVKKDEFNLWLSERKDDIWEKFGFALEDAIIIRKKPVGAQAIALVDSFAQKATEEELGKAKVVKANKDADVKEASGRGQAAYIENVGKAEGAATQARLSGAGEGAKVITEALNSSTDWRMGLGSVAIAGLMAFLESKNGQQSRADQQTPPNNQGGTP